MKIINTFFKKLTNKNLTWRSPNGIIKNETDHFLINDSRIVLGYEILSKFQMVSDHGIARVKIKFEIKSRTANPNKYKYKQKSIANKYLMPTHKIKEANNLKQDNPIRKPQIRVPLIIKSNSTGRKRNGSKEEQAHNR